MNIELSKDELKIARTIYNTRLEYLVKLGEIKLSEINNKKMTEDLYFNMTELNTRETQLLETLDTKYGKGSVDLSTGLYVKEE